MKVRMEFDTNEAAGWKVWEDDRMIIDPKKGSEMAAYIVILHHDSTVPIVARFDGKAPPLDKIEEALIPTIAEVEKEA